MSGAPGVDKGGKSGNSNVAEQKPGTGVNQARMYAADASLTDIFGTLPPGRALVDEIIRVYKACTVQSV